MPFGRLSRGRDHVAELDEASANAIAESSPTDVWVSGNGLFHYDGVRFMQVGTQAAFDFHVSAPDDVWTVASPKPDGFDFDIWRWNGRDWARQHAPFVPLALTVARPGELWATPGIGVIHRRVTAGP